MTALSTVAAWFLVPVAALRALAARGRADALPLAASASASRSSCLCNSSTRRPRRPASWSSDVFGAYVQRVVGSGILGQALAGEAWSHTGWALLGAVGVAGAHRARLRDPAGRLAGAVGGAARVRVPPSSSSSRRPWTRRRRAAPWAARETRPALAALRDRPGPSAGERRARAGRRLVANSPSAHASARPCSRRSVVMGVAIATSLSLGSATPASESTSWSGALQRWRTTPAEPPARSPHRLDRTSGLVRIASVQHDRAHTRRLQLAVSQPARTARAQLYSPRRCRRWWRAFRFEPAAAVSGRRRHARARRLPRPRGTGSRLLRPARAGGFRDILPPGRGLRCNVDLQVIGSKPVTNPKQKAAQRPRSPDGASNLALRGLGPDRVALLRRPARERRRADGAAGPRPPRGAALRARGALRGGSRAASP